PSAALVHPLPHSFPTRRSSDLMARIAYLGPSGANILDPRQIEQFKVGLAENGLIAGQNVAVEYFWADGSLDRLKELATELGRREDRKSTRLNSSHVAISYAVFC